MARKEPVDEAGEPARLEAAAERWRAEFQATACGSPRRVQLLDWMIRAQQAANQLRAMRAARQRLAYSQGY